LSAQSFWPIHSRITKGDFAPGCDLARPLEARRCTVQLSSGRLYLDAVASAETALLGHDLPPMWATDQAAVERKLSSLAPGYTCVALKSSFAAATELAAGRGRSAAGAAGRVAEVNAINGDPATSADFLIAHENETLGRCGRWFASTAWKRTPDLLVVGEALALGFPFGALLARDIQACTHYADAVTLARVAAAVCAVESEGLLEQGREVADYLMMRLRSVRESCPQIESVHGLGLCIRIAFAAPLTAAQVRREMCERGVLVGVDAKGRLAIDPPLALRIAEADVIIGALRGALLGLPMVGASASCGACEEVG
jgi:acetylornithine/succinyldiaminopimelate/putrescine aminotransferase